MSSEACKLKWQSGKAKAKRACCCIVLLLLLNSLMLMWVGSRMAFVSWWMTDPANANVVEIEQGTFCTDICNDLQCSEGACDAVQCLNQCNNSLQEKLSGYFSFGSSESNDAMEMNLQQEENEPHHHGHHHGHHHHDDDEQEHEHHKSGSRSHDGHHQKHHMFHF
eukprot:CAMPEP_0202694506 /NCGR_PEP_ID=MMETSP1385-20130828/8355_1 /ASSEMBLY_ACC=CAM_ASM_000861 /TAXON_ID=933848 /ORGANISM="Elphidium margaritaceum" /LENGTH=164 /DNA_ID=CAMNT_0049350369 /DNA_START=92 /DNA_END=586 /DNA_ORIENTATION=+